MQNYISFHWKKLVRLDNGTAFQKQRNKTGHANIYSTQKHRDWPKEIVEDLLLHMYLLAYLCFKTWFVSFLFFLNTHLNLMLIWCYKIRNAYVTSLSYRLQCWFVIASLMKTPQAQTLTSPSPDHARSRNMASIFFFLSLSLFSRSHMSKWLNSARRRTERTKLHIWIS